MTRPSHARARRTWSRTTCQRVAPIASTAVRSVNTVTLRKSSSFPLTLYAVSVGIAWRDGGAPREVRLETDQIDQGER